MEESLERRRAKRAGHRGVVTSIDSIYVTRYLQETRQARSQTSIKGGSTLGVHAFTQLQSPLIISGGIHNMAHFYMGYHTILKIGTN